MNVVNLGAAPATRAQTRRGAVVTITQAALVLLARIAHLLLVDHDRAVRMVERGGSLSILVRSRRPSAVQTRRARRAVSARSTAGAVVALEPNTCRAARARRTLPARALRQIDALVLERDLVSVSRVRQQTIAASRLMLHRVRLGRSVRSYLSVDTIL